MFEKLDPPKTQCTAIRNRVHLVNVNVKLMGSGIDIKERVKNLGMTFCRSLRTLKTCFTGCIVKYSNFVN